MLVLFWLSNDKFERDLVSHKFSLICSMLLKMEGSISFADLDVQSVEKGL